MTDHDITETIVFPLPIMSGLGEDDYANTERMLNRFQVLVDGKVITPNRHVRILMNKKYHNQ
ncbi:DUF4424 family protein [Gilliamella sp. wkB112]|uniref:DUF4424 family protein n=1 Tax=Gilliamella sp. wkB112 TaxID=3120257 RepID=UPI00080EA84D|nr:DUF4424 family protein [Gilliamella apicola]OCG02287.1 hypothetical protein A9G12_11310 [Gilliamella apicola]